jgi:hypothetical protein
VLHRVGPAATGDEKGLEVWMMERSAVPVFVLSDPQTNRAVASICIHASL